MGNYLIIIFCRVEERGFERVLVDRIGDEREVGENENVVYSTTDSCFNLITYDEQAGLTRPS